MTPCARCGQLPLPGIHHRLSPATGRHLCDPCFAVELDCRLGEALGHLTGVVKVEAFETHWEIDLTGLFKSIGGNAAEFKDALKVNCGARCGHSAERCTWLIDRNQGYQSALIDWAQWVAGRLA